MKKSTKKTNVKKPTRTLSKVVNEKEMERLLKQATGGLMVEA